MRVQLPAHGWRPRDYQRPLWDYLEQGGKYAVAVWHRRAGKDEVALHRAAIAAHERVGTYWHMLPEYSQARKAIWDAINPNTGRRRIDDAFPLELRATTRENEMFIGFRNGSTWQVVGSDNFNSLLGAPPIGIVYSEWSIANPLAHAYLSPILAENNGWALFIYTARGYNHGHSTYDGAKKNPDAFSELLTVEDTKAIGQDALLAQLRVYIDLYGEEHGRSFWRQEYWNDWSAANIGSILGPDIEQAERDGRILEFNSDTWPVEISSDIGFRDTAAWWFWQPKQGGFDMIDYDHGVGMDADDWIERLKTKPYQLGKIWLPHDARVKTFQSKHSALERFLSAFGSGKVGIVPQSKKMDRINAARRVIGRCQFHRTACKDGLSALRSWSYTFDEAKKIYSREPLHDWASHGADAYSYGCQIMEERVLSQSEDKPLRGITAGNVHDVTLDEMWAVHDQQNKQVKRI